jgi:3-hydroxyacyl-CoA dehydrogenase
MDQAVTISVDQGVALIRIDNPPVNALSPEVISGLDAAIDTTSGDASVIAVVVFGPRGRCHLV